MLGGVRARAVDLAFAAGWGAVRLLPEWIATAGFRAGADIALRRQPRGVRQLRANLRRVVGPDVSDVERDELLAAAMRSYCRYWMETFRLPAMDHDALNARVDALTIGAEHIDAAVAAGRGLIVALPHMGNWDVGALWLVRHGVPFTTVAERLKPESLFDRFVDYRESLGMEVLALTGGARPPVDELRDRLQGGGCVALVADRDLSRSGVDVEFFGETARMPAGPTFLAATTGAALLPVGMWFTPDGGWGQHIGAPVALPEGRLRDRVTAGTQAVADAFAAQIAAHPSDWHMLQRLWLADLDAPAPRSSAHIAGG
jgi:phosphatidylinositol dimannoside acyltransferase